MPYRSASFMSRGPGVTVATRTPATLVVASDGTAESEHTLEFARAFAHEDEAVIHVISVCEPAPDSVTWPGLASVPLIHDPRIVENGRREAVRSQIERVAGNRGYWPLTVTSGSVATSVAQTAANLKADIIVTGRGRHRLSERLLGEEHLLRLIRESPVPVLAVEDTLRHAPERIAIGVDFGQNQPAVAQSAARWAADNATVFLVHARPAAPMEMLDAVEWYRAYDESADAKLRALAESLDYPGGASIETRLVNGHPGMALTHLCATEDCDLVVAGAQGTGFIHRLVVGSVTTYLLRHARCSLLTIPALDDQPGVRRPA